MRFLIHKKRKLRAIREASRSETSPSVPRSPVVIDDVIHRYSWTLADLLRSLMQTFAVAFSLLFCLQTSSYPQIADASTINDTLAVIGTKVITAETFETLYKEKLTKFGLTDNGETRRQYLFNLVDDEVLMAHAKLTKLDRTKDAQAELRRLRLQELLNAYSVKHVSSSLIVTDDELRDLFVKLQTKIKVRHIYAPTKEKAEALYRELMQGKTFGELAKRVFTDPALRDNGGSLGLISVDEMDIAFEKAAFAMKVGEVSKPVKTVQGYSIIKVDEIQRNPLITETEFINAKERLARFQRKRNREDAAREYTAQLRTRLHVRFNEPLFSMLYQIIQQHAAHDLAENASGAISPNDVKKTVVMTTTGGWSLKKLIHALSETAEGQRKWIRTKENWEDFVAGVIMRAHIAHAARAEKLDALPTYEPKVQYAFDTYLLSTLEDSLKSQMRIAPDSLRAYYERNKGRFASPSRIRLNSILLDNAVRVDSLRRLLEAGASFEILARQFSVQRLTADKSGDMGYFRQDELGRFGRELFALRVGEWKGPLAEDGKYLFVKCTGRESPVEKSFEESAQEIENVLAVSAWQDLRRRSVDIYKKQIRCRVYPDRVASISLSSLKH